ncbi:nucleoside-diphosphate kinase [Candidatus Gracilibacteria bacterium]|jgi:nucleoside-diphosphate kinase|nr:nucleoside-diphosphate kinase [Candidatus Gracilibacteria bacterium]
MHMQRTLVLIKPDGVQRGLIGEIISRFEKAGLKMIGLKMVHVSEDFARKHYTEDLELRRGAKVRNMMVTAMSKEPIVAIALEGVEAIEVVRKMIGSTEPKAALPGTIRGDYAHISYGRADAQEKVVYNLVHASGDAKDASYEVPLWFSDNELVDYKTVHEYHVF